MSLRLFVKIGEEYKELSAVLPNGAVVERTSISIAINKYLELCTSQKCSKNQKVEATLFLGFEKFLADNSINYICDIKPVHVLDFQNQLSKRMKPSSVNRRFCVIKNFLSVCVKWGISPSNPAADIKKKRAEYNPYKNWTESEFNLFIELTSGVWRQLLTFMWLTGCRPSEAKNLKWTDINHEASEVIFNCGKNTSINRPFPISSKLSELLHNIKLDSHYVFSNNKKQINNDNLYHYVKKRLKRLGFLHLTVYGLRHSFAERLAKQNVSPFYIQKLMGHSDIKTTMNYVHDDKNSLKQVLENIKS